MLRKFKINCEPTDPYTGKAMQLMQKVRQKAVMPVVCETIPVGPGPGRMIGFMQQASCWRRRNQITWPGFRYGETIRAMCFTPVLCKLPLGQAVDMHHMKAVDPHFYILAQREATTLGCDSSRASCAAVRRGLLESCRVQHTKLQATFVEQFESSGTLVVINHSTTNRANQQTTRTCRRTAGVCRCC